MGQIRKINGVYYIEFYARGLLYSQVAGEDLPRAEELLRQVEEKIAGGEALTISRYIELPDFFERFGAHAREQYGPKSAGRFEAAMLHFSGFLTQDFPQIHRLDQVTPSVMESYKTWLAKNQKPKITNLTILLLRDILDFGIKLGFLNDNPSLHVRLLPWPKGRGRKPTPRWQRAQQLLSQGAGIGKLAQLLCLSDVGRVIYYANLIPLSREDMYN